MIAAAIAATLATNLWWHSSGKLEMSESGMSLDVTWGARHGADESPAQRAGAARPQAVAEAGVQRPHAAAVQPTIVLAQAELPLSAAVEPPPAPRPAMAPAIGWDGQGRVMLMGAARPAARPVQGPSSRRAERLPPLSLVAAPPPLDPNDPYLRGPLTVDCYGGSLSLKPIHAISNKIAAEPGYFPTECLLIGGDSRPRCWDRLAWTWRASDLCHHPLYFEEPALERYGHALPPPLHPFYSAAHFFVSAAMLPYKMGLEPPEECVYSLGYYRPGSRAPCHVPGVPISLRGAVLEGAVLAGAAGLFWAQ